MDSASSRPTIKLPEPRSVSASWPQTPSTAQAVTAASRPLAADRYAAVSAPSIQPVPVTQESWGVPFLTRMSRVPSVTISTFPLASTTVRRVRASAAAARSTVCASSAASASTPEAR